MKSFRVLSFSLNLSLFTIDLMFDGIIFQINGPGTEDCSSLSLFCILVF